MAVITINLLSGNAENEQADFALRFGRAALARGHKFNLFLFGNAANLASTDTPWAGDKGMNDQLAAFMDDCNLLDRVAGLVAAGADIQTCHTTEYVRGSEGDDYIEGVKRGSVGASITRFFLTSDVAFTVGNR